jgi:hypothetical protein
MLINLRWWWCTWCIKRINKNIIIIIIKKKINKNISTILNFIYK